MRTSLACAAVVGALALCVTPARAQEGGGEAGAGALQLSAGTFQLGGNVGFTSLVDVTRGRTNTGFDFSFSPTGGYFVVDHLELLLGLQLDIPFGDYYQNSLLTHAKRFGVELGARYHFGLASRVTLYAGLRLGLGYSWYELGFLGTVDDTDFSATIPAGVLVAVHSNVAIDAGVRMTLRRYFGSDVTQFTFPIGFLGVEAYF